MPRQKEPTKEEKARRFLIGFLICIGLVVLPVGGCLLLNSFSPVVVNSGNLKITVKAGKPSNGTSFTPTSKGGKVELAVENNGEKPVSVIVFKYNPPPDRPVPQRQNAEAPVDYSQETITVSPGETKTITHQGGDIALVIK